MEKYDRGEIVDEEEAGLPFPTELVEKDVAQLKVQAGSKIRNLLNFALPTIRDKSQLVIVGRGPAISKVITIAEMLKRKERGLDQWNKIGYKKILEFWEPQEEGMFRLQVTREIPVMHILLSKSPLDASLPGVQKFVIREVRQQRHQRDRKSKQTNANRMRDEQRPGSHNATSREETSEVSKSKGGPDRGHQRQSKGQSKPEVGNDTNCSVESSSEFSTAKKRPRGQSRNPVRKQLEETIERKGDQTNGSSVSGNSMKEVISQADSCTKMEMDGT